LRDTWPRYYDDEDDMKIELANGVTLLKSTMVKNDGAGPNYQTVRKSDVRKALAGKINRIHCHCPGCKGNGSGWRIGRTGKSLSIGCVRFSPDEVAKVRKWLRTK